MTRGVVLVRTGDPGLQLQAARTTLSLSLGDRQADLLVTGDAIGILSPAPGTETGHCLQTIGQVGLLVQVDADAAHALVHHSAEVLPHSDFVARLAGADFLQVF
ncbi:MAG: hypothetical protein ABR598_02815 [Candidatus Dormibacteria bacterium]